MKTLRRIVHILVLLLSVSGCQATTHWLVTEEGLITQQLNSHFNIKEPHNFISFLKQDQRGASMRELEQELERQKAEIEANEDKDLDLEQRFLRTDSDCVAAQQPLAQQNLYPTVLIPLYLKGIKAKGLLDASSSSESGRNVQPNCTKMLSLPFSVHAYDHLQGVQERHSLTNFAEENVWDQLKGVGSEGQTGRLLYRALRENKTSWELYTMATFYWRAVGNSLQVIECGRRALHFAPHKDKNAALVNMASVLHRNQHSASAVVLAQAALESGQEVANLHVLLGCMYATVGEYDQSVHHFQQAINSGLSETCWPQQRIHAVRCHQKLEQALEAQHVSLQRTLSELQDYKSKQDEFEQTQKVMRIAQRRSEDQFESNLSYHRHRLMRGMVDNPHCEVTDIEDGPQFVMCTQGTPPDLTIFGIPLQQEEEIEVVDTSSIRNNCIQLPNGEESCFNLSAGLRRNSARLFSPGSAPTPPWSRVDWPSEEDCRNVPPELPDWSKYAPTYLPPENKGLRVAHLVNDNLNLFKDDVHPLPWFPPVCVTAEELKEGSTAMDYVGSIAGRAHLPLTDTIKSLSPQLLAYIDSDQASEEELSQRILTAFEEPKNVAEKWLVYNLAGFYWLVIGNNYHGVECLRRALHRCPVEYADVPLVNAAGVLLNARRPEDAVQLLRMALVVNSTEPITHFVLANALAASSNLEAAANEFVVALTLDPKDQYLNTLRQLKCFRKREEMTAQQTEGEEVGAGGQRLQQRQSRTVCSTDRNGERQCQTETRTREFVPRESGDCTREDTNCDTGEKLQNGKAYKAAGTPLRDAQAVVRDEDGSSFGVGTITHHPGNTDSSQTVTMHRGLRPGETLRLNSEDGEVKDGETVPPPASGPNVPAAKTTQVVDVSDLNNLTRLPWPTLQDCELYKKVNLNMFYTTWVSVTAKNVRIEEHIDFQAKLPGKPLVPVCGAEVGASMHTLDHLAGMAGRESLQYTAEQGLDEALEYLRSEDVAMSISVAGTRIAMALQKNSTSWVLTNLAAVYWRRAGNAVNALNCLRVALHHSDHKVKDLALISIANIFHRSGLIDDGITVAQMAWEISREFVLCQFTLANLYAAKGQFSKAIQLYESMLIVNSSFGPAEERLKTIKCAVLQMTKGNPASMLGK
ncbi:tetratricopeptide repeat protein 17-like [Acanthaster planci]|uniref:Tetratricopeptide repeat protein 17-like n=1 Tax=Acanthaster planci TaxID=133434 RepID=A0A8B7XR73_ACAPL|nr:tetratricopeptide repeat protein 17-like [Acanthaster planci]